MDHTIALIQKSHEGDEEARAQIVEENTGLVWCIVRRFTGRGTELEDLFQIGTIGLLKAIDKFDLSYEVKFSTYAVPMISGEIKRFLRDDGMIKVSRSLKELSYKGYQAQEVLGRKLGREPSVTELAEYLDVSPDDGDGCMYGCRITTPAGIQKRRTGDFTDGKSRKGGRCGRKSTGSSAVKRASDKSG